MRKNLRINIFIIIQLKSSGRFGFIQSSSAIKIVHKSKTNFFYIVNAAIKHRIVMFPHLPKREGLSSNLKR